MSNHRLLSIGAVTAAVCALAWATYSSVSLHRARTQAKYALQSHLVASFTVMQLLRSGDTNQALSRLENHCYATAVQLAEEPGRNSVVLRTLLPELRSYRARFATNRSAWSPVEQRLEEVLEQIDRQSAVSPKHGPEP